MDICQSQVYPLSPQLIDQDNPIILLWRSDLVPRRSALIGSVKEKFVDSVYYSLCNSKFHQSFRVILVIVPRLKHEMLVVRKTSFSVTRATKSRYYTDEI